MHKLTENIKIERALSPQTLNNTNAISAYYSLAKYERIVFAMEHGTLTGGATAHWEIYEATDDAGAGAQELSAKSPGNKTGDDTQYLLELSADDLTATFTAVAIKCTETATANALIGAVVIRGLPRYAAV